METRQERLERLLKEQEEWRDKFLVAKIQCRRAEEALRPWKTATWVLVTIAVVLLLLLVAQKYGVIPLNTPSYGYEVSLIQQDNGVLVGWATIHEGGEYVSENEAMGAFLNYSTVALMECYTWPTIFEYGTVVALAVVDEPSPRCLGALTEVFGPPTKQ